MQGAGVSGSVISNNVTDGTNYAVAALRSSATGVNSYGNQSQWTVDIFWYGSSSQNGKSFNERVYNPG